MLRPNCPLRRNLHLSLHLPFLNPPPTRCSHPHLCLLLNEILIRAELTQKKTQVDLGMMGLGAQDLRVAVGPWEILAIQYRKTRQAVADPSVLLAT